MVELDWGGLGDGGVYGVEDGEWGYAERIWDLSNLKP